MSTTKLSAILATLGLFFIPATVNLEVPLYPVYARMAQVGAGVSSLTQLGYCLGALPVLILLGGLPTRWGARAVLNLALALATLSTVIMIIWPSLPALFGARVLHGIAIAFGLSAGATLLAENNPEVHLRNSAASVVSISTALGFGAGALSTTLLLRLQTSLTPISFHVCALATTFAFVALFLLSLQKPFVPSDSAKLTPLLRPPAFPTDTFFCGLVIAAAWAVSGIVIAVVPQALTAQHLENYSGIALFCVNATGAACFPFIRKWPAFRLLKVGLGVLALGGFVLAAGVSFGNLSFVLGGAILSGASSYGFCYLGSLSLLNERSGHEKARALAGYFLMAYLGFCLPSVVVGFAADTLGMTTALFGFAAVLALCCGLLAMRTSQLSSLLQKQLG